MSKQLAEAVNALTRTAEAQLEAVREEMRRQERREQRERLALPEVQAQIAALRRPPRRFSPQALVRAAPWIFAVAFQKEVPLEFYAQVEVDTFAVVCPCGSDHTVNARGYPMSAGCGRYFLYDGEAMRVWSGTEQGPEVRPQS